MCIYISYTYNVFVYIWYICYIYTYIKKTNFIVCDRCEHKKVTFFSWISKKLSIFFSKNLVKQTIFLFRLPNLNINKYKMKQEESIKSLEILLDENLTWKGHLKTLKIILLNLKRHYKWTQSNNLLQFWFQIPKWSSCTHWLL